jgi:hypothetical protein
MSSRVTIGFSLRLLVRRREGVSDVVSFVESVVESSSP